MYAKCIYKKEAVASEKGKKEKGKLINRRCGNQWQVDMPSYE